MLGSRRRLLVLAVPVVLLVGVAAGVWWFFIRDDSPSRGTAEDVEETLGELDGAGSSDEIEGIWTVDPSIGTPGEPGGTYAGYRIQEELASIGGATAVGRTGDVTGEITVEGGQVTAAEFEVDMTTLESNEGFRDNRLRDSGLETDTYPTSTFSLAEPIDLPDEATSGEELTYEVAGELELHGVTQEVAVEVSAWLRDGTVSILASAPVVLADYDIEKPSAPRVLGIADEGEFELGVFLTKS